MKSTRNTPTETPDSHGIVRGPILRPAQRSDLAAVRALLDTADLPYAGVEDFYDRSFVVTESGGVVVATIGVELYGRYGLMRSLAVDAVWRSAGIGRSLVEDRLDWAKASGLVAVFLITLTPEYFVRFGFQPVRRDSVPPEIRESPEFSTICPETATVMARPIRFSDDELRRTIRDKYAAIASTARQQAPRDEGSCCDSSCCGDDKNVVTSDLYSADELSGVPDEAAMVSLGCGNPTALAELRTGEVVLDLGSGGGIDVLLSARRVGPEGKAYGLDMTDEMLALARENQRRAGVPNVEFLKGEIEAIPLPDDSVDVVISNCVINLSTEKPRVLAEAFRVLRPGGRFAVSDIVARGEIPEAVRRDAELWAGCLAGSLEESEYRAFLRQAGFTDVDIQPTRVYAAEDFSDVSANTDPIAGLFMSAFIRATKPAR